MVAEVWTLTAASSLLQTWSGTIKYFYSVVKIFLLPSIARSEVAVRPNYFLISLVCECRVAAELSSLFTPGPTHFQLIINVQVPYWEAAHVATPICVRLMDLSPHCFWGKMENVKSGSNGFITSWLQHWWSKQQESWLLHVSWCPGGVSWCHPVVSSADTSAL